MEQVRGQDNEVDQCQGMVVFRARLFHCCHENQWATCFFISTTDKILSVCVRKETCLCVIKACDFSGRQMFTLGDRIYTKHEKYGETSKERARSDEREKYEKRETQTPDCCRQGSRCCLFVFPSRIIQTSVHHQQAMETLTA